MASANRRVHVILNHRSGTADKASVAQHIASYLGERGVDARVELVRRPDDLPAVAARAAEGDAEIIVAGGGDGTIATVAGGVLDTPKVLGVLPLGTFNYFAQRIGVPPDLDEALNVIAGGGVPKTISVGEVNGRVFLNNSSIGLYPAVLKQRETTYRRFGRSQAGAYLSAAFVLVRRPRFLHLQLSADGTPILRRTPLLFVGVNPLQLEAFGIEGDACLADGRLASYIARPLSAPRLWRLALRGYFRGLDGADELELLCARELNVTLRGKRIRVAMDGEVARLNIPLRYRLRVNALRVLAGAPQASAGPPA
jgi:diacylglycerol kinase family enzyme